MSHLRGGHWLSPGGLATVIRQVPASLGLGLASTANLPGSSLPLFSPLLRHCGSLPALDGRPIFSPQLTAVAGNYAYTHLQIWANGVSVPPGGCRHYHLDIASVSCIHVDLFSASPLVTLEPLGQASKLYFFAPLRLLMDISQMLSYPAGLSYVAACLISY
jgi:hypothetical protein